MGRLRVSILSADMVWISIAGFVAYRLDVGFLWYEPHRQGWQPAEVAAVLACLAFWAVLYFTLKLDCFCDGWDVPNMCSRLTVAAFLWVSLLTALSVFQNWTHPPMFLAEFGVLLVAGLILLRSAFRWLLIAIGRAGGSRRVVILGDGPVAKELAGKIACRPDMFRKVIGFLCPSEVEAGNALDGLTERDIPTYPVEVPSLLKQWRVQELIVVLPRLTEETHKLLNKCREVGVSICVVPESYELYVSRTTLTEIGGVPMVSVGDHKRRFGAFFAKRLMDLVFGAVLLAGASPFLLAAVAVFLAKGRKPLRVERRCGEQGRLFPMYRLNVDRDAANLRGLDRTLAHMSLTELPQLFNVLCGQMSIVGPRPESPDLVKHFSDWQRQRMNVRPGLTGLAQVHGLREMHSSEEKFRFDMQYILDWSPFGDLTLILQTVWTLTSRLIQREPAPAGAKDKIQIYPTVALQEGADAGRT